MKKIVLYLVWLVLYAICAGLGFVEDPQGLQKVALLIMALIFFVPGALLLADAFKQKDKRSLRLLRWISIASLGLTLIFLVANVASALGSAALGDALYEILIFVSVPMICSRQWFLSMFLWASLLCATFLGQKKK